MGGRALVGALTLGIGLATLALPRSVVAHALLQSSEPAAGSTVGTAPTDVTLTFGETPDPRLSSIKVLDSKGTDHASGPLESVPGEPLRLRIGVGQLGDGVYTVSWRTLSAVDGHVAAGSFAFGVGVAVPTSVGQPPAAGSAQPLSVPATIARWLLYLGLVTMFGVGFVVVAVGRPASTELLRLAVAGGISAAGGALGVVALQWADAGADLGTIVGTSIGMSGAARLALAAVTGALVAAAVALPPRRRLLLGLAAVGAAGSMAVDVLAGHAAAGSMPLLDVAIQWLHVLGVGLWIGGLGALLLSLRGEVSEEKAKAAKRFSSWATVALVVVAGTGVVRAVAEVGTFEALVGGGFGLVVIAKTILLLFLIVLGATNRFINVPAAIRQLRGLRRVGTAEVALGTVVLVLSAALVNLAPPVSSAGQQGPAARPVIAVGSDFGTSVRVRLVATPGAAGFNDFALAVRDFDTGEPVEAPTAALRFDIASSTGVGPSRLDLARTGPGTFAASGGNLSIDGIWKMVATVAGPNGAVEVPLLAAAVIPSQPVQVNAAPGVPTIYSVALEGGESVQVYLDPGTPGKNDVHATIFDAAGTELPVTSATMALFPAGAAGELLSPRLLEPGHFVASTTADAGEVDLDVVAADTPAGPLHIHVTINVQ
ncbi:MAG: copper resistance CopC/CopD family protein [Chloroflexota bacterium]